MANRRNIHIFIQAKGGVGKSFLAVMLTQYLRENLDVAAYDVDPSNQSLVAYSSLYASKFDLLGGERTIEPGSFDELNALISMSDKDMIIDTGSSTYPQLFTYLTEDRADEIFYMQNCNLILHVPIADDAMRADCLVGLGQMCDKIKNAAFVVWINGITGPVFNPKDEMDLHSFEETEVFKQYRSRIKAIINVPRFAPDTLGKVLSCMTAHSLTFADFASLPPMKKLDNITISEMQKFRARMIKDQMFKAMYPIDSLELLKTHPLPLVDRDKLAEEEKAKAADLPQSAETPAENGGADAQDLSDDELMDHALESQGE